MKYIEAYFNNFDEDTVFVWFCPGAGDLEEQSKVEMEKHMKDRVAKDIDDTLRNGFDAGDTVFINWEKVNNANKKAMTESEHKTLSIRLQRHIEQVLNLLSLLMKNMHTIHQNHRLLLMNLIQNLLFVYRLQQRKIISLNGLKLMKEM